MDKIDRAFIERRKGKDRRSIPIIKGLFFRGQEKRKNAERRTLHERRKQWVRISKWSSVPVKKLKISKYILGETKLTKNNPYR